MYYWLAAAAMVILSGVVAGCGSDNRVIIPKVKIDSPQVTPASLVTSEQDKTPASTERKIIYNGTLEVEVKDFAEAYQQLTTVMQQQQAYFVKTELKGDSGTKRTGVFTIKVPVAGFQTLVVAIAALGNPVQHSTDSQDVTEEFIDTEARVKNLKVEEEALNKLLKEAGTKLEEVFRIREHIRLNREHIERAEGRLQALAKLTTLSTITLTLRDKDTHIAPSAAHLLTPLGFGDRAAGTWATSLNLLQSLLEAIGLIFVAVFPWTPILAILAIAVWIVRVKWRNPAPAL
jgi:hypothetical protein